MDEERDQTEEMKLDQDARERDERRRSDEDPTEAGTATHERRADKAAYLKQKLAERERSEREAKGD